MDGYLNTDELLDDGLMDDWVERPMAGHRGIGSQLCLRSQCSKALFNHLFTEPTVLFCTHSSDQPFPQIGVTVLCSLGS